MLQCSKSSNNSTRRSSWAKRKQHFAQNVINFHKKCINVPIHTFFMNGKMGKKLKNLFARDFAIIRFCCVRIVKRQKFEHMGFNRFHCNCKWETQFVVLQFVISLNWNLMIVFYHILLQLQTMFWLMYYKQRKRCKCFAHAPDGCQSHFLGWKINCWIWNGEARGKFLRNSTMVFRKKETGLIDDNHMNVIIN